MPYTLNVTFKAIIFYFSRVYIETSCKCNTYKMIYKLSVSTKRFAIWKSDKQI